MIGSTPQSVRVGVVPWTVTQKIVMLRFFNLETAPFAYEGYEGYEVSDGEDDIPLIVIDITRV